MIENIISSLPRWQFYFYRAKSGEEIDLLMVKGRRRAAAEIKASKAPVLRRGFWAAAAAAGAREKYLIAPVDSPYSLKGGAQALSPSDLLKRLA